MEVTRKLVLTGARAGRTCELRKLQFTDGVCRVNGPENEVEALSRYMARVYKAFPEGSEELALHQRMDRERLTKEAPDGAGEAAAGPGPEEQVGQVPSDVQSQGTGPAQGTAEVGDGAASPDSGTPERHPDGDGEHGTEGVFADQNRAIHEAVMALDPANDENWTADGKPRIDAVAAATGRQDLTRKMVEAVVPGFTRPAKP